MGIKGYRLNKLLLNFVGMRVCVVQLSSDDETDRLNDRELDSSQLIEPIQLKRFLPQTTLQQTTLQQTTCARAFARFSFQLTAAMLTNYWCDAEKAFITRK